MVIVVLRYFILSGTTLTINEPTCATCTLAASAHEAIQTCCHEKDDCDPSR